MQNYANQSAVTNHAFVTLTAQVPTISQNPAPTDVTPNFEQIDRRDRPDFLSKEELNETVAIMYSHTGDIFSDGDSVEYSKLLEVAFTCLLESDRFDHHFKERFARAGVVSRLCKLLRFLQDMDDLDTRVFRKAKKRFEKKLKK